MKRLGAFLLGILTAYSLSIFAAQQTINIGSSANDGTGDTLRVAGQKMNANFTELYAAVAGAADLDGSNTFTGASNIFDPAGGTDEVTISNGAVALAGAVTVNGSLLVGGAPVAAEVTGTFEAVYTNMCTTTPSQTWNYTKVGNIVILRMVDNFTCTSDSTAFQSDNGGIPAAIIPANDVNLGFVATVDNTTSTDEGSCIKLNASNARFEWFRRQSSVPCDANTWTNSGTKGVIADFQNATYTYSLVN